MISLWQMTVIREIMRTGSVSGAARILGRTQPALSAAVKEIEKRLDFQLFTREHGRLQPAPETYFLLQRADEIISQVEHLEQMMRTGGAASAGKIAAAQCQWYPSIFCRASLLPSPPIIHKPVST